MKDDRVYLLHIKECLDDIAEFVRGGRDSFLNDKLVRNATLRSLQILAESATRLSNDIKTHHPEIPWRKIHGFRNILVHDYLGLDYESVWLVIETSLPQLGSVVRKLLSFAKK